MNDTPQNVGVDASLASVFTLKSNREPEFPFAVSMLLSDSESEASYFALVNANIPQQHIFRLPVRMLPAIAELMNEANALAQPKIDETISMIGVDSEFGADESERD